MVLPQPSIDNFDQKEKEKASERSNDVTGTPENPAASSSLYTNRIIQQCIAEGNLEFVSVAYHAEEPMMKFITVYYNLFFINS